MTCGRRVDRRGASWSTPPRSTAPPRSPPPPACGSCRRTRSMPECGPAQGKGDAMWRALSVVRSDVVAYLDADTADFHAGFVLGLLGPLICEPEIQFVKGCFRASVSRWSGVGIGIDSPPRPGRSRNRAAGAPAAEPARARARGLRPAARGRDGRAPRAARAAAVQRRLWRGDRDADRRMARGRASMASPRSISVRARTPTSRCASSPRWPTRCSSPPPRASSAPSSPTPTPRARSRCRRRSLGEPMEMRRVPIEERPPFGEHLHRQPPAPVLGGG